MTQLTLSTHINAPIATVFEMCTDFQHLAENISHIKRIEMLTEGAVGVGTRFKETRIMFGREATEEMEVTQLEPNRCFTLQSQSCGCLYQMEHLFQQDGTATRLELNMHITPQTFFARLMSPLSKLMMGPMRKCIEADFEQVKSQAEKRAEVSS